jgi:hypothetical protein
MAARVPEAKRFPANLIVCVVVSVSAFFFSILIVIFVSIELVICLVRILERL